MTKGKKVTRLFDWGEYNERMLGRIAEIKLVAWRKDNLPGLELVLSTEGIELNWLREIKFYFCLDEGRETEIIIIGGAHHFYHRGGRHFLNCVPYISGHLHQRMSIVLDAGGIQKKFDIY